MTTTPLNIKKPFGPFIGKVKMPQKLIDSINNFVDQEYNKNKKDYLNLNHGAKLAGQVTEEIKLPKQIIEDQLINFLTVLTKGYIKTCMDVDIAEFKLISSWVVRQYQNEYNPAHFHGGHLSGVGYLKLPESFGESFQEKKTTNSNGAINFIHGSKQFLSNAIDTEYPAVGDFYIFPNYLIHSVNPFYGNGERRSVSFNAKIDEKIYDVYSL